MLGSPKVMYLDMSMAGFACPSDSFTTVEIRLLYIFPWFWSEPLSNFLLKTDNEQPSHKKNIFFKRIGLWNNLKLLINMLKVLMLSLLFLLLPSVQFLLSLQRSVLWNCHFWNLRGFFCYLKFLWLNNSLNFLSSYLQRFFTKAELNVRFRTC